MGWSVRGSVFPYKVGHPDLPTNRAARDLGQMRPPPPPNGAPPSGHGCSLTVTPSTTPNSSPGLPNAASTTARAHGRLPTGGLTANWSAPPSTGQHRRQPVNTTANWSAPPSTGQHRRQPVNTAANRRVTGDEGRQHRPRREIYIQTRRHACVGLRWWMEGKVHGYSYIYTPVPVVYVHGDGISHQQETVHSPAAVAPLQPGRPPSPSRRPRGDQDHPPGRALIPSVSPGRATRPLPTGQRRCQLAGRLDNRPRAPMAHRQLASPRPPSPTLPPSLLSPISSGRRRARPQSPIFLRQLASPRALSIRSPRPIPSHPLAVARPAPAQPPYREGGSPDCPPWPTAPAPTPAPTPTPAPCEPASRTKRPRAMVAGQRRRAASTSAARLGHTPTHRPARRLSHRLSGPHRPSVVRANAPVSELDSQGDVFAPNVGHPLRSTHLTAPTGQCRRQLASLRQLAASLPTGQLRCPGLSRPGPGSCRPLSKTLAPRRCQLAAGLGRAEDRRGSTPSVVSASSRSPPTARARTGTSVDGEVCLHKSSQGSG